MEKCLGRRLCRKCGKNYNVADIYLPASGDGRPEIVMPPLSPPDECAQHMEQRADDTEPVIRRRLEVYAREAQPVERFYAARGKLLDFEIFGGIPQAGMGGACAVVVSGAAPHECARLIAGGVQAHCEPLANGCHWDALQTLPRLLEVLKPSMEVRQAASGRA